ncbi:hypothetical protein EMCRGX_G018697 [Ephydatia muelleri]
MYPTLATSVSNTFIAVSAGSFLDTSGNPVLASSALQTQSFVQDTTSPSLLNFTIDMNNGHLALTFSDVILISYLYLNNPSSITLQGAQIANAATPRITSTDLNVIKATPNMCIFPNNTYLALGADSFTNIASTLIVPILSSNARQAAAVFPDITRPTLQMFYFNLSLGVITFVFDKAVKINSFVPSLFTLQSSRSSLSTPSLVISAGGISTPSASTRMFNYTLTQSNIDYIKLYTNFGTNVNNTYISVQDGGILDNVDNAVKSIASGTALQASEVYPDIIPPILSSFTLDFNTGILYLNFSETVNISSFVTSRFYIQNGAYSSNSYQLNTSTTSSQSGNTAQIILSTEDINGIKMTTTIATDLSTTYLRFDTGAFSDMSGLPTYGLSNGLAQKASGYVNDTLPPRLVMYSVDMGAVVFSLTFSETIDIQSLNNNAFLLMNTPNIGTATSRIQLTGGVVLSQMGSVVNVQLTTNDANYIKSSPQFYTSEINGYISITPQACRDRQGNLVVGISSSSALPPSRLTVDTVAPTLFNFTLDINSNALILTFSEPVQGALLVATGLQLQSNKNLTSAAAYLMLTGGTPSAIVSNVITVSLLLSDINTLKQNPKLATSVTTTYLSFPAGTAKDANNNNITAVTADNATQAAVVIADTVRPSLLSFQLTMPATTPPVYLLLTFSETVNASSLNTGGITLVVNQTIGGVSYSLMTSQVAPAYSTVINVTLSSADLKAIRSIPPLGQTVSTTYITLQNGTIKDMAALPSLATSSPIQATAVTADLIPPTLSMHTFDKNLGHLVLTFSEPIQSSSFSPVLITLNSSSTGAGQSLVLSSPVMLASTGPVVTIQLTLLDQNTIKNSTLLGLNNSYTYLSFSNGLVQDIAGNNATGVSLTQADSVLPDVTSPIAQKFSLDLLLLQLTLVLNEPINPSSLDVRHLLIQNERADFPTLSLRLTNYTSITTTNLSTVLIFGLAASDVSMLQSLGTIATSPNNTFLSIDPEAITDTSGNMVARVSPRFALAVMGYEKYASSPIPQTFTLNLNTKSMGISFSNPMITSTLKFFLITISSGSANYTFVSSSALGGVSPVIQVSISAGDFNRITMNGICKPGSSCTLILSKGAAYDVNGLSSLSASLSISDFVSDATPPTVVAFSLLDMNTGLLNLSFSEAINVTSFNSTGLILQAFFEGTVPNYRISSLLPASVSASGTTVSITLSYSDLNSVKVSGLCTLRSNCYLLADVDVGRDYYGNPSSTVLSGYAGFPVQQLIYDTTRPMLNSFNFDLNSGLLTLQFSEPVSPSPFNYSGISLQSQAALTNTTGSVSLSVGTILVTNGSKTLILTLAPADIIAVKMLSQLASSQTTTFLSMDASVVSDLATLPNQVTPIPAASARAVSSYTPDMTKPVFIQFTMDLNADQLVLSFNEPVRKSSLNFSGVHIGDGSTTIPLSNGTIIDPSSNLATVVKFIPVRSDIEAIKGSLLLTGGSDVYVQLDNGTIQDRAGNFIPSTNVTETGAIIPDTAFPYLVSFSFDMILGRMQLTFSDVMDVKTFEPSAITIQDSSKARSSYTLSSLSTSPTTGNGYTLTVIITAQDLLGIKLLPTVAKSRNSTWLTMQAFAIADIGGANVLSVINGKALQAQSYISDITPPQLQAFSLDLTIGLLSLTFNEAINLNSVILTSISLCSSKGVNTTWLQVKAGFISDLNFNNFSTLVTIQTSNYTADTIPPTLQSFTIDMNTGILVLSFAEAVKNVSPAAYTLQPYINSSGIISTFNLMNATATMAAYDTWALSLSQAALNSIHLLPPLTTSELRTYLSVMPSGAMDYPMGFPLVPIPSDNGIRVTTFIKDTKNCSLVQFSINLSTKVLSLTFDEVVSATSLSPLSVSILNSLTSASVQYNLTGGTRPPSDSTTLDLTLSLVDHATLVGYRQQGVMVNSPANTYLSILPSAVTDVSGNPVNPITILANSVIGDATAPTFQGFSLNLSSALLTMTFSEYIDVASIVYSNLVLQNTASSPSAQIFLRNSKIALEQQNNSVVTIALSPLDFFTLIKTPNIGTSLDNTYLLIQGSGVADLSGNRIATMVLPASQVILNTINPRLQRFSLNVALRRLVLTFSEPVNPSTALPGAITLYSNSSGVAGTTLLNSSGVSVSPDSTQVTVQIDTTQFTTLQAMSMLSNINNTFLTMTSLFIKDYSYPAAFPAVNVTTPLQVADILDNLYPPYLMQFILDMNTGNLTLFFSKSINASSFNAQGIVLQSAGVRVASTSFVQLTGGPSYLIDTPVIVFTINTANLNAMKVDPNLAKAAISTYIVLSNTTVSDFSGSPVTSISSSNALQASDYIQDATPPSLQSFQLDKNTGVLSLSFSEVVQNFNFMVTSVSLQRSASATAALLTLTANSTLKTSFPTDIVNITLSTADLFNILLSTACTDVSNCFATIQGGMVRDVVYSLPNSALATTNAALATSIIRDQVQPKLVQVNLIDMDKGIIVLSFDKPVNVSSISITGLAFASDSTTIGWSSVVGLTNSTHSINNGLQVQINLSSYDLDALKSPPILCKSLVTCYARLNSSFIQDMSGNPVQPVSSTSTNYVFNYPVTYISDTTPPVITAFDLDLNSYLITFMFNEIVRANSFKPTYATIQSSPFSNATAVTLTGANIISSQDGTIITVQMVVSDVQLVLSKTNLALDDLTTWLNHTSSMIVDTFSRSLPAGVIPGTVADR